MEKKVAEADLSNPILNSPFDPPERHFELGERGPTGKIKDGRRRSESFIPVPRSAKGSGEQQALDFDPTGERLEQNSLINDIRLGVERWRMHNWNGVTPYTRKLLAHWTAGPHRGDDPVFFCQREAAETAIYLAEVAGRHGSADYRRRLEPVNAEHNSGLPRVGLKMATGTGKTVVMAMLIAWQTINKAMAPSDARFAKRFLVVTPGITIRDRLGVLNPERDDSYYRERDLVPPDLWHALLKAEIEIVNYHTFLPRDAKEIKGIAANTRKLLRGGNGEEADAFREEPAEVVARILRDLSGGKGGIVVLNDEAHHCYQDNLEPDETAEKEDKDRNREARVWFRGLQELQKAAPIKAVYDLSATPYYLKGTGYSEGFIFPWVVSDFSLMDAIESGIVKVPRIPIDDDAKDDQLVYLHLWDNIQPPLPKRVKRSELRVADWTIPKTLEGALQSLYRSYARGYSRYRSALAKLGEPPPVMIVVCPNTAVSKLVFDWISGWEKELDDGTTTLVPGELELLSNVEDGIWAARQRTILIDTVQLESGEPLGKDFKQDAAHEIEAFKHEFRRRNPGADVAKIDDAALLREAMNTVGKKGKLGEQIRCVVSVGMLTEGWDANTVTHILGVRPFRSQLLCEQVVGRGLRRRSYAVNEDDRLEPEYAEVYGVPFAFIPSDRPVPKPRAQRPAIEVRALPERDELAIEFPKLDGYRIELPDEQLHAHFTSDSRMHLDQEGLALWVKHGGVIGESEEVDLDQIREARPQAVAFALARELTRRQFAAHGDVARPWLFPRLVEIARQWLDQCVTTDPDVTKGHLLLAQPGAEAAEKIYGAVVRYGEERHRSQLVMPIIRTFDPQGSTHGVSFLTRKVVMDPPPEKSHLNHVVLDGPRGNTWEEGLAQHLESDERVAAYVKNERLGFTIPYVHKGRSHDYLPDFLVRLAPKDDEDEVRTLIVEVSGSQKSPGPTKAKAETARDQWCAAVNNWGEHGRWGYVEVHDPWQEWHRLDAAIDCLYGDDRELLGLAG